MLDYTGFSCKRRFWGRGTGSLREIALCESYFSTKLQTWDKTFFRSPIFDLFFNLGPSKMRKITDLTIDIIFLRTGVRP